jgi:CBS domain-containing protein
MHTTLTGEMGDEELVRREPEPLALRHSSYLDSVTARELMTPGVVTIVEDASLKHAFNAMVGHRVHAVLVVGREQGRPLGWVTSRGLLTRLDADAGLACVREAITERPISIQPVASAREVLRELSQEGVSHLMVSRAEGMLPEGVITELDLMRLAGR